MKELTKKRTYIFITLGVIIIAISRIVFRYVIENDSFDFAFGMIQGLGIGLIVIALINGKLKDTK